MKKCCKLVVDRIKKDIDDFLTDRVKDWEWKVKTSYQVIESIRFDIHQIINKELSKKKRYKIKTP